MKLFIFLFLLLVILLLLIKYKKQNYETFEEASNEEVAEGASPRYDWGKPKIKKQIIVKPIRKVNRCEYISDCDINRHRDLHKYVLKSSIPPCPNMSKYILKSEIPPYPDMSKYVLKSKIPPYPDMSKYILKSEIPNCENKQIECPYCPECKTERKMDYEHRPNRVINKCLN